MTHALYIAIIVGAYLLGSVPFGLLIAKANGIDLRSIGSGNIGATNVSRALGRKWAYVCFALDALKGLVPMLLMMFLYRTWPSQQVPDKVAFLWVWLCVGCAIIVGHIFPVYLKFKGGKGVATSFGVALGLWPYLTICALTSILIWAAVLLIWRYVSLASMAGSVAFPVVLTLAIAIVPGWDFAYLWPLFVVAIAIPLIVITRHRQNIKRLITGTERRISAR